MTGSGTRSESESGPEPDGADGDGTGDEGGEGTKRNANVSATIDDPAAAAEDDDREWHFALDEVGEDAEPQGRPEPEPGSPSLENAAFVVLGIVATLGVVAIVLF